jgi:hypothetical protein
MDGCMDEWMLVVGGWQRWRGSGGGDDGARGKGGCKQVSLVGTAAAAAAAVVGKVYDAERTQPVQGAHAVAISERVPPQHLCQCCLGHDSSVEQLVEVRCDRSR